jgi:hypothetical protein
MATHPQDSVRHEKPGSPGRDDPVPHVPQPLRAGSRSQCGRNVHVLHTLSIKARPPTKETKMSGLTEIDAVDIWLRYWAGEFQHKIAAHYGINQGRISEIVSGKRFPASKRAAAERLND